MNELRDRIDGELDALFSALSACEIASEEYAAIRKEIERLGSLRLQIEQSERQTAMDNEKIGDFARRFKFEENKTNMENKRRKKTDMTNICLQVAGITAPLLLGIFQTVLITRYEDNNGIITSKVFNVMQRSKFK